MTLDETIKEAKITAILFEKEACKCVQHGGSFYEEQAKAFRESAREFGQTAEWLEELKAYREAYKTTDKQQEWIPCSEKLPNKYKAVLTTSKDGRVRENFINAGGWSYDTYAVVAWMPLPEPWKGADK